MKKFKIDESNENIRVDIFVKNILDVTRATATNLVKEGRVLVNEISVKPSYKLQVSDVVDINVLQEEVPVEEVSKEIKAKDLNLEIVYEDDYLFIVNKPIGLVVHPASSYKKETLVHGLLYLTSELSDLGGSNRLGIIHRLDKDTCGLLIVAKTNDAHEKLSRMLKYREITRKYYTLVHGNFPYEKIKVDAAIGRHPTIRTRQAVVSSGRNAVSYFTRIKQFKHYTYLEAQLETGRTHQIRVHLAHLGYPIVGDTTYGRRKDIIKGQFLCAHELSFIHPFTNEKLKFNINLPEVFLNILNTLH